MGDVRDLFCNIIKNEVKQMKELYLNAEMDVVEFSVEDVIVTSPTTEATTESIHYNPNCENEGPAGDAFL